VIHVDGRVNPVEDVATINFELALSDLLQVERRIDRLRKGKAKVRPSKLLKTTIWFPLIESHRKSTRSSRTWSAWKGISITRKWNSSSCSQAQWGSHKLST